MKGGLKYFPALLAACCLLQGAAVAQDRKLVLDGNNFYNQQKFKEAAETYRKALEKTPSSVPASFNLGNALMKQEKYEEARKVMQEAAKTTKDKGVQSGANYNTGNAYMQERKWSDAVTAYKNALRANPKDGDAKYNLSYAQSMLRQEQQKQQQQQNQDPKKGGQQNPQPQPKDGQQKQDQQPKPQQQQPKPDNNSMTKQQADNLLNALEDEEKKLRDKKQSENGVPARQAKDW